MTHRRIAALGAALTAIALGTAAAPASAANYTCESSALRGQIATAPAIEPVTANKGQSTCRQARGGVNTGLPGLGSVKALFAETGLAGPASDVRQQTATASGGVADLALGPPVNLGVQIPGLEEALAQLPVLNVPPLITLDLRKAVMSVLQASPQLLRIQVAAAYARARCVDGKVELTGSSNIAGIKLLGLDLPTDEAVSQVVNVLGDGIDLSKLDPALLLPPGVTLDPVLANTIRGLLAGLPKLQLPAAVAELRLTPNQQIKTANGLTQRALHVNLKLAGQQLLDLTLGEATVGANDVDCKGATAPPTTAAEAALQCTNRRLVLSDVYRSGNRVRLVGYADRRYIGRTVAIHQVDGMRGGGPRVARVKIKPDGSFETTAPLPRKEIRNTNRARYQARLGKERSMRLKLMRRMQVRNVKLDGKQVRVSGRVVRPLAQPVRTIEVRRRVSCDKWKLVKRIRPRGDGSFTTRVEAPGSGLAGTYRFATKVRKVRTNPKTYPTFTLPRFVDPR